MPPPPPVDEKRPENIKPLFFREGLELILGFPLDSPDFRKCFSRTEQSMLLEDVSRYEKKTFIHVLTKTAFVATLVSCQFNCIILQKTVKGKIGLLYDGSTMSSTAAAAAVAPRSSKHVKVTGKPTSLSLTSLILNQRGVLLETLKQKDWPRWNANQLKREVEREFLSLSDALSFGLALKNKACCQLVKPEGRQHDNQDNSGEATPPQSMKRKHDLAFKREFLYSRADIAAWLEQHKHLDFSFRIDYVFQILPKPNSLPIAFYPHDRHLVYDVVIYAYRCFPYISPKHFEDDASAAASVNQPLQFFVKKPPPMLLPLLPPPPPPPTTTTTTRRNTTTNKNKIETTENVMSKPNDKPVSYAAAVANVAPSNLTPSTSHQQQQHYPRPPAPPPLQPQPLPTHHHDHSSATTRNCQTGVTANLTGLTLAYQLGVISKEELHSIAKELQQCKGYLWAQYDTQNNVRFLSLMSAFRAEQRPHQLHMHQEHSNVTHVFFSPAAAANEQDILLEHHNNQKSGIAERCVHLRKQTLKTSWLKFFSAVKKAREECIVRKKELLIKVMSKLKTMASAKGKAFQCHQSLQAYCEKFDIYVFEEEDWIMHFLKIPMAHFSETLASEIQSSKKSNSPREHLRVIADSENFISSLASKFFTIKNMYPILAGEMGATSELDYCGSRELLKAANQLSHSSLHSFSTSPTATATSTADILPRIFIDHEWTNLKKVNDIYYSPGRVSNPLYPRTLKCYLSTRANQLLALFSKVIAVWKLLFLSKWDIDVETLHYNTFSTLSFKTVWLQFYKEGGPLCQAIEKSKHWTDQLLRYYSRGGFSYSFNSHLSRGDPLFSNATPKAVSTAAVTQSQPPSCTNSVMEYDLSQSYGYAASTFSMPAGFCVGYARDDDTQQELTRVDDFKRFDSWEFLATYATIHRLLVDYNYSIRSVFHNYSPLGLFYVDKYPIDLVVVTECRKTLLFQFDGIYVHGCAGELKTFSFCQEPKQYAQNQTFRQVRQKTEARNAHIQNWIERQNRDPNQTQQYSYVVITDCHHENYKKTVLREYFMKHPTLACLIKPYSLLAKTKKINNVNEFLQSENMKDLTYIIICKGSCHPSTSNLGLNHICGNDPLFYWSANKKYQTFTNAIEHGNLMITKEFLQHYIKLFNFKVTSVSAIFFYRKCNTLNQVYKTFLNYRQEAETERHDLSSNLFKRMINYSCGYFGLNPKKTNAKPRVSVVSAITSHALEAKNFTVHSSEHFCEKEYFVKATYSKKQGGIGGKFTVSLPIFVHIIEGGKMRLHQCLTFIEAVSKPNSIRFLYCNIDNMILASTEESFEKCIHPCKIPFFAKFKHTIFNGVGEKSPGKLKLEWTTSAHSQTQKCKGGSGTTWHFISPRLCTYVLHYSQHSDGNDVNSGHGKMSSFKNLNLNEMYRIASSLLTVAVAPHQLQQPSVNTNQNAKLSITQLKRVNKLANTQKESVTISI